MNNQKYKLILIGSLVFFVFFVASYFITSFFISSKVPSKDTTPQTEKIIEYNRNLPITQQIFNNCSIEANESAKMLCVKKWAVENYNYVPREEIYSIDDMFEKGADCKSYSVYYATLAKMMGYSYAFLSFPDHVVAFVYYKNGYCILDQDFGTCIRYGDEE